MKKGLIKMNLKTFIEVVVGLLIVLIVIMGLNAAGIGAASMATSTSAMQLAKAINEVSQCIDEQEVPIGLCERTVNISLPQNVQRHQWGGILGEPFSGYDPMWAIWHGVNLEGIAAIGIENDIWDWEEISADRCDDDLCYGLVEGQFPGKTTVEPEAMKKLRYFWIVDPCYATVKVKATNKAGPGCEHCIYICYVKQLEGPSDFNFCHCNYYQPGKLWPEYSDAWEACPPDIPGNPVSAKGYKCGCTVTDETIAWPHWPP